VQGQGQVPASTSGRLTRRVGRVLDSQVPYWQRLSQSVSSRSGRSLASLQRLQLNEVDPDDVRDIAEGAVGPDATLYPFTIACGLVSVNLEDSNYTLTVRNGIPASGWAGNVTGAGLNDECTRSFGMGLNGTVPLAATGPFYERRCQRCPVLLPGTPYVALLLGDGGRSTGVVQVRFTTSSASPPPPVPSAA
jgi:hypothetical protein